MAGLYFEEIEVGREFHHEFGRTVTEMDNTNDGGAARGRDDAGGRLMATVPPAHRTRSDQGDR